MTSTQPDFVLIHPDRRLTYGHREPGQDMFASIRAQFGPDLGTTAITHRLRGWHCDQFTADMPANPLATELIARLGYQLANGWYGLVAISMEEDLTTNEVPPLAEDIKEAFDQLGAV